MYWYSNRCLDSLPIVLIIFSSFLLNVQVLYQLFGLYEFLPHRNVERWLGKHICGRCNSFKYKMEQTIYPKRFSVAQIWPQSPHLISFFLSASSSRCWARRIHSWRRSASTSMSWKVPTSPLGVHEHWLLPSWFHPWPAQRDHGGFKTVETFIHNSQIHMCWCEV